MWSHKMLLLLGCIVCAQSVLALWTCSQDADCSVTTGAVCSAGNCVCPLGQQIVLGGSKCADLAPYYTSPCFEDHQCSHLFTNFECRRSEEAEEGKCFCQEGSHYFHGRCWKSVDYGGSCAWSEECMGALRDPYNLACVDGTCSCADGYYERQRGECRRIGFAVGDGCVVDEDCQFENGVCDINNFKCVDGTSGAKFAGVVPRSNVTLKSLTRQHRVACNVINTCASPFVCSVFGVCVCPSGYYASNDGSLCLAELGSPSTEEQCAGFLAEVKDGICTCPSNIYFDENMRDCVKATRLITESCVTDQMCHTFGAASRCGEPQLPWFLRNCECTPEISVWDDARVMCRLFVGVGEYCEVNSDCLAGDMEIECIANSEGQGVCTCPEGYVNYDGLCLTTGLHLGDSCQMTQECTETANTVCENGRCSCGESYQEVDGFCAPTIGGTCVVDTDCTIENTVCVTNNSSLTCQCGDGFVEYNDICWPALSSTTSECEITAQCSALMGPASHCVNNHCQCEENYHSRDGGCWPQIELFGVCTRTSECYLKDFSERVVCRNSLCQCSFDYPYSEQLHTCTSSATSSAASLISLIVALFIVKNTY